MSRRIFGLAIFGIFQIFLEVRLQVFQVESGNFRLEQMPLRKGIRIRRKRHSMIIPHFLLRDRTFKQSLRNFDFRRIRRLDFAHGEFRHAAQICFQLLLVRNEIAERPINQSAVSRLCRINAIRLNHVRMRSHDNIRPRINREFRLPHRFGRRQFHILRSKMQERHGDFARESAR